MALEGVSKQARPLYFYRFTSRAAGRNILPENPCFSLPVVSQRGEGADWAQNAAVQG